MNFKREKLTLDLMDEAFPLFKDHFEEIARYKDIPLNPAKQTYLNIEKMGKLRFYSMRDMITMKLLGYAVFIVDVNAHYQSSIQAKQDILFIKKEMRGALHGYNFIRWCDEQLQNEGIEVVYQHVKSDHNFGKLLERLGYELFDHIYARRLN